MAGRPVSRVVVVGGGVAGLAAACRLAEEGAELVLFESRKTLGGRATAFTDPASGQLVDNGQHLLMGCNEAVKGFLAQTGSQNGVLWQSRLDLPLASSSLGRLRLRLPALPGVLSGLAGMLTLRGLPWADRLDAARALNVFIRGGSSLAGKTVQEVMEGLGTSEAARSHLLEPLAVAVTNDSPKRASALALSAVVREAFGGGAAGAGLGIPRRDLESLLALPARRFIEARGGRIETQRPVEGLLVGPEGVEGVTLAGGESVEARAVVAAVPPWSLEALAPPDALPEGIEKLEASPIVSATFWLDRPVVEEHVIGLVGTTAQWVFNRSRLLGLNGPGQVIALTVSAADHLVSEPKQAIIETFLEDLRRLLPEAGPAGLEHAVVVKEQRATVPLRPEEPHPRPGCRSKLSGLYLAGGWTSKELPDTLEASVRSGREASEALLADGLLHGR